MAVHPTKASKMIENCCDELTSHQLISLLMSGMLERIVQAKASIQSGNEQDKEILFDKIVAIINGLRSSLNFEGGGEIAMNLDILYTYMLEQLAVAESSEQELSVLEEVAMLVAEVKSGWDQMVPLPQPQFPPSVQGQASAQTFVM